MQQSKELKKERQFIFLTFIGIMSFFGAVIQFGG
jgi:hypothetical protein